MAIPKETEEQEVVEVRFGYTKIPISCTNAAEEVLSTLTSPIARICTLNPYVSKGLSKKGCS